MSVLRNNKKNIIVACPVCAHKECKNIYRFGTSLFSINISFCKNCGFVFQNPRPSENEWSDYYSTGVYDKFHRPHPCLERNELESDTGILVLERIQSFYNEKKIIGNRVCEIGAGDGNVICAFKGNELYAIEPSIKFRDILKKKEIKCTWDSIDFVKETGFKFDILLMRHVLEHIYYPNKFLETIGNLLADKGIVYIAVPNIFGSDRIWINMITYPHISYFSTKTLKYLCKNEGYNVLAIEEGVDEIWCLISKKKNINGTKENEKECLNSVKNVKETYRLLQNEKHTSLFLKRTFIRYTSYFLPIVLQKMVYKTRSK